MNEIRTYFSHPLLRWPLLFGLATGLLCFGYFLVLYALGIPPLGNHKSLDFGIHIILITATVWYFRRTVGQGRLHLWEGLTIGYVVNTVGAFVTGWLIYFFITQVQPDIFTQYLANSRALLLQGKAEIVDKLGAAQFQSLLAGVGQTKPGDLITDEIVKKSALAVLPVLIISLIFRKQDYSVLNP
jgi:hypothetical protein